MLFTFLLVVHGLIAAALVGVILMQKSEGGGLGMGSGSPSGLMSARGAADFLTRATSVLATLFVLMAFLLATLASLRNGSGDIDTSLAHQAAPGPITAPTTPTSAIPLMGATTAPAAPDAATSQALAPASAGPPTKIENSAQATPTPVPASTPEHAATPAPSLSHLKKIDTHPAAASVGIEGVSTKSSAPAVNLSAPAKTIETPKPAPTSTGSSDTPTPAPSPASGGNSQ